MKYLRAVLIALATLVEVARAMVTV